MSTTPTTTLQIENNTFTIESDINSILVVNSSTSLPSTTTTTTTTLPEQQQQQQMNIESNGYVKHLELELKKLKEQFEETKQENHLIREYNTHLARKLEDKRRNKTESFNEDDDDDADSIVTYVDVQNIANKIEYYLIETNKLFKTNLDLNDSMKYLIKNIWSLIAHEYNDKNLDQLKLVKDELVDKLQAPSITKQKIDSSVNTDNTTANTTTTTTDIISLNEIESLVTSYKIDAETLKDKLFKQNELIKELKQQFESTSICKVNEPAVKESYSFSPGTSPSDLFLNSRLLSLNKYSVNTQTENDDSIQTKETTTATTHEPPPPPPQIQNTNDQTENNVYYLHNLDDFVAIQTNNTYDASLLDNNNQQNQQQLQQQQTNNELVNRDQDDLSTLTNTDETSNNIFSCPCCGSSFDSTIFEANDIFIKKFEKHVTCSKL